MDDENKAPDRSDTTESQRGAPADAPPNGRLAPGPVGTRTGPAEILNAEGHRTGSGQELTAGRVAFLRQQRGLSHARRTPEAVIERIRELKGPHTDAEIANILNHRSVATSGT